MIIKCPAQSDPERPLNARHGVIVHIMLHVAKSGNTQYYYNISTPSQRTSADCAPMLMRDTRYYYALFLNLAHNFLKPVPGCKMHNIAHIRQHA